MKKYTNKIIVLALGAIILTTVSCKKDNTPPNPFANLVFQTEDQMARPAINTVFNLGTDKDAFNVALPSAMGAAFQTKFQSRLLALNPNYTTNALGLSASAFTGVLATDVLTVSTTGTTTFFDGTNVLTGRALADDVIDTELLLIFGGPNGTANPGLTSDKVSANDKAFLSVFPYLATPW
ncbi:MAG: DUF4331 domain-containing protein [Chitinophagaceae bacterium]|nr:DUF4331 domain-containing protein [Chitinophagaceae bacterium]